MVSKFVVHHSLGNGCHFTLHGSNGRVIATSEHYDTHRDCVAVIESVRRNAPNAVIEDATAQPAAPVDV